MKIKSILCLSFLCVSTIFSSCSQDEDILNSNPLSKTDLPSRSEIQESKDLAMPSYELSLLSEEVKQKRAASIILSDYIVLENNQYKLTALSFKPKKETYLPLPGSLRIG